LLFAENTDIYFNYERQGLMDKELDKFILGGQAKDALTSFQGTIVAKVERLMGAPEVCLQPAIDKDGKWVNAEWFPCTRLVVV
jgi:hypothetical protein